MKILLISYADYNYDGRLRALVNVFSKIGDIECFIKNGPKKENMNICNEDYKSFIRKCVAFAGRMNTIDCLVLDNRKATIPGLMIQKKYHPQYVVQDCRELYLIKEVKHFAGKMGCIFEKIMVKRADVVICANQERARIMMKEYNLSKEPLSYENLRQLQYESTEALEQAKNKLGQYIKEDEIRIISSSGCSIKRTNDILVKNLRNVKKKCRLFLVGNSEKEEEQIIKALAAKGDKNEVTILGQLNQTELKYLISHCHIGIVNYGQYDTNNRFCASGKLYEYIYEGIPVVTTSNPPLKRICDNERIGVADDEYYNGINEVISNHSAFLDNVKQYTEKHTIERNDQRLIDSLIVKMEL